MAINKLPTLALESNAITADLIASGAITAADISDGEISADKLAATLDLSSKTITLAVGAVTAHQASLSITESQISDLQSYLTAETNDLTSAVTWANVPDTNITQTSVTQHQASLSITESQISDLQSYVLPNDSPTFTNTTLTGYLAGPATFTIDPAAVGDNTGTVVIAGNLQVDGTTTTINSTTVEVDDLNITLASGAANSAAADGAGITIDLGSDGTTALSWNHTKQEFYLDNTLHLVGDQDLLLTGSNPNAGTLFQYGQIRFGDTVASQYVNHARIESQGGYANTADLRFHTSSNNNSPIRMYISPSGNVGVGHNAPDEVLDVKGNFTLRDATGNLAHGMSVFGDDDQYAIFNQEASGDGGLRITTLSDSTVASSAFQVNAVATTVSNDGNNAVIRLRAAKKNGTTETSVDTNEDVLSINNTGTELIVVKGNGYMGMGTSDPSSMLHLKSGVSYQPHILLENSTSSAGDPGITFADSVENYAYRLGADDSGNGLVITYKAGIDPQHGVDSEFFRMTTSGNISVAGNFTPTTTTQDLGSPTDSWQNIYTQDMHLSNESRDTGNEIDGTKGNWTIQEGAEDLYIINNKSGKRFRFKLEELD